MDLRMARLCLDCEEIFEDKSRCPRCSSETWHPIMGWIRPMSEAETRVTMRNNAVAPSKSDHREFLTRTDI